MANAKHLEILKSGVDKWNKWREENEGIIPDLRKAELSKANLAGINLSLAKLSNVNLFGANLDKAFLYQADLQGANLCEASLVKAELSYANLRDSESTLAYYAGTYESSNWFSGVNLEYANLRKAILKGVDFRGANLKGANLTGAYLGGATLVQTNVEKAILNNCNVYGTSVWDLEGEIGEQKDLIITRSDQLEVTVDNIKVAQFIYLLMENKEIRDVIDTLTAKAILILGRFTDERKEVLDSLKESLRDRGYLPILFDFEKPGSRNLTETIKTLAGISRFVIADLTDAKSIIQELMAIIPHYPSIPVQPLLLANQEAYAMFESFRSYPWVCEAYRYDSTEMLLANLEAGVISPAEQKGIELKGDRR